MQRELQRVLVSRKLAEAGRGAVVTSKYTGYLEKRAPSVARLRFCFLWRHSFAARPTSALIRVPLVLIDTGGLVTCVDRVRHCSHESAADLQPRRSLEKTS